MMLTRRLVIVNRLGLHARAAAKLVNLAAGFASDIRLCGEKREADAKSIMEVLMLAAAKGTELELHVNGEDAEQALTDVAALIERGFDED